MKAAGWAALVLLGACQPSDPSRTARQEGAPPDLEQAAIRAGVIADPRSTALTGSYAQDGDRLCIVPHGQSSRIGVFIDYDDRQMCSGSGIVTRAGENLHVRFDGGEGCEFDARFEGDRIVFPGRLPDDCQALCSGRASMAGLEAEQVGQSVSEAATLRDAAGRALCPS